MKIKTNIFLSLMPFFAIYLVIGILYIPSTPIMSGNSSYPDNLWTELEFKEQKNYSQLTDEERKEDEKLRLEMEGLAREAKKRVDNGEEFDQVLRDYTADSGLIYGYEESGMLLENIIPEYRLAIESLKLGEVSDLKEIETSYFDDHSASDVIELDRYFIIQLIDNKENKNPKRVSYRVLVFKLNSSTTDRDTGLNGTYISDVITRESSPYPGEYELTIQFNEEGTKLLNEITSRNIGKQIAVYLDGEVVAAPRIEKEITDGKITLFVLL